MKLVRTRDESGAIVTVCETSEKTGNLIVGDIYGDFSTSEVEIPIRERLVPIRPAVIIGIAQNYRDHIKEMNGKDNPYPSFFIKLPNTAIGHQAPIQLPQNLPSFKVDYEAELAVVLKKSCVNATIETAWDYVLGITAANDVTARDWQKDWGGGQFCRGKGFNSFCPLGPRLVTPDEFDHSKPLSVSGYLNGECVQKATTADLIFSIPELIAFLSSDTTLPAGTVILTGTPSGVGQGQTPPRYLQSGDTYTVEVEHVGKLINPVHDQQFS